MASIFGASPGCAGGHHHVEIRASPPAVRRAIRAAAAPPARNRRRTPARPACSRRCTRSREIGQPGARPFLVGGGTFGDAKSTMPQACQSCNGESVTSLTVAPSERNIASACVDAASASPAATLWSASWKCWMTPMRMPFRCRVKLLACNSAPDARRWPDRADRGRPAPAA